MFIHKDINHQENSLAVSSSLFNKNNLYVANPFKVGMLYKPTVLDNEEFWQVFENDEQITKILGL